MCGILITEREGNTMKNIKIYVKKTPISEWQLLGEVATIEHANKVWTKASAKGYYCKIEQV
jgi:hypothetical protein